jgi:F-type H+-transporting ATPase subunit c
MKRLTAVLLLSCAVLCLMVPLAFAEEAVAEAQGGAAQGKMFYYGMAAIGCGIAIGFGALGAGIGQGIGTSKACEGIARNPATSGKVTTTLIIGLAMMESLTIYALVVVLIILFVNPFKI